MNKIILIGNLTRDPELRTVDTVSGAQSVCSFTIAVNRRGSQEADFFRITCWRQLADNCAQYLAKGRKVYVSGPLTYSTYQANDGSTRVSLDVTAVEVEFLSSRNDDQASAPAAPAQTSRPAPRAPQQTRMDTSSFQAVETDELPF